MIQFTEQQVEAFRLRSSYPAIVNQLVESCTPILKHDLRDIPKQGIADWSHYYYCPECSVALLFELDKPDSHRCPSCSKVFSGGHYDGAWVRLLNNFYNEGAYHLGLLYMLTGESRYADRCIQILTTYATYYPSYQVHGNIPYNNPGKANAQTLDEAYFLKYFAFAYDLVADAMTSEQRSFVTINLFEEGLEFLKEYRSNQIHNHEVICNGAIGILALLLDDPDSLDFALNGKYGLLYQLEQGTLSDGFWFECSTAYHFYALEAFFHYEKFAMHTRYSNLSHPMYRRMFDVAFNYLRENISFPRLNDTKLDQGDVGAYDLFEFAYASFLDPRILALLQNIYKDRERSSLEAFFYGVDRLPEYPASLIFEDYISHHGLGNTVLRGPNHEYLLFRHGPYGGEHDHYDRLSISYNFFDTPIAEDFGTCGYGAPYHYDYFKRTGTHNTVVIDEENQAPSSGRLISCSHTKGATDIKASVTWRSDYPMPDSLTIKEWSDEAYEGVTMTRQIHKTDDYIIDIFNVMDVKPQKTIDFVMHFNGREVSTPTNCRQIDALSQKKPFSLLSDVRNCPHVERLTYANGPIETDYFCMDGGHSIYLATGMDNPTVTACPFYIERANGPEACFVHVIASHPKDSPRVIDVRFSHGEDEIVIEVFLKSRIVTHRFPLTSAHG